MYSLRPRFLFALLFILLLCSSAQATTSLQITVQDTIDNTSLPHATVFINGANYARTNTLGNVYLTHSGLNDQEIKVTMSGYDDWSQTVNKNTTLLLVNMSRKTLTFTVDLFDSDTLGPISGASINLTAGNTSQMKQTDSSGSATFAVMGSTIYSIDITASNYESRSGTIDMGAENQKVQYKLLSGNSFSFVVTDKDSGKAIPGAEVRLNAILAGKTDDRGILITPVIRGNTYTIEIKKDGYKTLTESRTISASDAIYYATLSKAPVGAFVYVIDESRKPMSNADVYVNGTLSGSSNEYGRMNFPDLVTGDYLIEVRKSGYVSQSRAISISGTSQDYTFVLPYESAAFTIFVQDKDNKVLPSASIAVDGTTAGTTDNNGQLLTQIPFNTDVNITVTKEGYAPLAIKKQVIQGNGTATVTLVLEKNMDWGLISMIVMGVIGIIILFAVIRILGRNRGRRHVTRRNEI
ncbi:MAG: carboxypeptidase-like regulatory domain-containing protein [Methanoregula sp.]|nr:carboxypeptidase-like regulatory domain-containing protein [Methanoregula sp.]